MSVLTPTIPERGGLLAEAVASVRGQTYRHYEHLILEDTEGAGCAITVNRLAAAAQGRWLFILADDDLLLPSCLQAHLNGAEGADIVYSPPAVWGEDQTQFHGSPPGIPSASLIRTELWRTLNGYDERLPRTEDRDFYTRAMERGAVFNRVPGPTWLYRFWGGNKSRDHPPAP